MGFMLQDGAKEDIPRFMEIVQLGWVHDNMWEPCSKDMTHEEKTGFWVALFSSIFAEPFHRYFVMVDEATGEKVGWTCLQVPAPQTEEYKKREHEAMSAPLPEKLDKAIFEQILQVLSIGERNGYDPEKDFHRRGTFIHPDYQKLGLGSRLTKHCNEVADASEGRIFVPARPSSKHMFEQNGYVVKDELHVDMERYTGKKYMAQNWLLIREPHAGHASMHGGYGKGL